MDQPEKRGRGRPPRPGGRKEPHTHRYDPTVYDTAAAIAKRRGEDLADVLGRALTNYVKRHGGSAPTAD